MKSLIVCYSYHHHNTEKIAEIFAEHLDAKVKLPFEMDPEELQDFDMVGFGSGIYSAKHHESLFELAGKLPEVDKKKVFIFSTAGITGKSKAYKDHLKLREMLQSKGYDVVGEFQCKGFNTNSFLKLFGGMNKGRPNLKDIKNAIDFVLNLKPNDPIG